MGQKCPWQFRCNVLRVDTFRDRACFDNALRWLHDAESPSAQSKKVVSDRRHWTDQTSRFLQQLKQVHYRNMFKASAFVSEVYGRPKSCLL